MATQIDRGLWIGGAEDFEPWRSVHPGGFVVSLASTPGADEYFVFPDDWLGGFSKNEKQLAVLAARRVDALRRDVLVACREGRNRACLVGVLVLQLRGLEADDAIARVKERRSAALGGAVLTNDYFEAFARSGWVHTYLVDGPAK